MPREFKELIRVAGMKHVSVWPYYTQSNGKILRWYQTAKKECIKAKSPSGLGDYKRNGKICGTLQHQKLHSNLRYITPKYRLEKRQKKEIYLLREKKLKEAMERRKQLRSQKSRAIAEGERT